MNYMTFNLQFVNKRESLVICESKVGLNPDKMEPATLTK